MGVSQALNIAQQGMRVTQSALSLVAGNVANADTPGYIRKTLNNQATAGVGAAISVTSSGVNRELDTYLQRQLRNESSGGAYAEMKAQFYSRLQDIYGAPGSDSSLETLYNEFTSAVQALSANPSDYSARAGVIGAAQALAQQINGVAQQIQDLRAHAELNMADAVRTANEAMARIADINKQLGATSAEDASTAYLLDQRDMYVDQLARLMDIRVSSTNDRGIAVFTSTGLQLVGSQAAKLNFEAQGTMTANVVWDQDPAKRGVGTVNLVINNAIGTDLIAEKGIRSGELAAFIEMRDKILVQAQNQLDEFAAAMARTLSDRTTQGTAAPASLLPQTGYDLDLTGLQLGNSISINYIDTATNTPRSVTFVRVDDPAALPLDDSLTNNPNDRVVGIDWSGGLPSAIAQMNAVFGGRITLSNPSGNTLRILDDGATNTVDLTGASSTITMTSLLSGSSELPFFMDGGVPFTNAVTASGKQVVGFANRISVNPSLVADASKLVTFSASTPSGDYTRPTFIYEKLTTASQSYSPTTGFGAVNNPFSAPLPTFLRQVMSQQGDAALAAQSLYEGQKLVVDALQQRFDETAGVNIDQEMANLVTLQTAYAANARVLTTIKEVIDSLMRV